jgi:hypothetical protein
LCEREDVFVYDIFMLTEGDLPMLLSIDVVYSYISELHAARFDLSISHVFFPCHSFSHSCLCCLCLCACLLASSLVD